MFLKDIGSSNKFYLYLSRGGKAAVMEYRYQTDIKTDPDTLRRAVRASLERFPFFAMHPYLDGNGKLSAKENSNNVPVFFNDDKYRCLGTDETNGYLFCVNADDDSVRICASHALADGRGIFFFSQLVIYEYLKLSGCDMGDEFVPYSESDTAEGDVTELLTEVCGRTAAEADGNMYVPHGVFVIPEECVHEGTEFTRDVRLIWDQNEFMDAVHSLGTTPACFMAAAAAQAMYRNYDIGDKTVVADVPVDLRAMLGSRAQSNFTANVSLPYESSYRELSMKEQTAALRYSLKAQAVKDNLVAAVNAFAPVLDMIAALPLNDDSALSKLFGGGDSAAEPRRTYLLSNIGAVRFPPAMDSHIKDFSLRGTNLESSPAFVLISFRDKGMLIMQQNYDDMKITNTIRDILKEFGVNAEISDSGTTRCHSLDPGKFDRLG